jgi:formate-dependent nitrite reductase membrane component NrfD
MADKADKDVSFTAPWTQNLAHRQDPNRVSSLQISNQKFTPRPGGDFLPADGAVADTRPEYSSPQTPFSQNGEEHSYYDVSILKAPVWRYEIAGYFFLGGLSAGAYLLARMAERFGGKKYRDLTRAGTWISFLSVLPCPLLLIHDLGDAKRFHHMLRVFKPTSPMSLGTWTLLGYSGMVSAAMARELLCDKNKCPEERDDAIGTLTRAWINLHDAAGVPLAIGIAGYTGVLLSCTANPMWCKNPWIGPLFSASAIGTGAAATSLLLNATSPADDSPAQHVLEKVDTIAHLAEAATMAGYLKHAGEKAKPLTHGSMKKHMAVAAGALIGAEVLKHLPLRGKARKGARMAASLLGLVSGFSLRWAFIYGAHEAGNDPRLARLASKPKQSSRMGKNPQSSISSEKPTRGSMGVNRAAEPRRVGSSAHNGGAHGIVPG